MSANDVAIVGAGLVGSLLALVLRDAGRRVTVYEGREDPRMAVTGDAGRSINLVATARGGVAHWPGGLCLCFPGANTINGRIVMAPGDMNLTFKTYLNNPLDFCIEEDFVREIKGDSVDADLFREYLAAWEDPVAYGLSHVGWGMNPRARWESMALYDKRDVQAAEFRAWAGNFLWSTGSNQYAGRFTLGHFDLPMRGCTITLDGTPVVIDGQLQGDLA